MRLGFVKLKKSAEKFVWVEPRIGYLIFSQLLFLHTVNSESPCEHPAITDAHYQGQNPDDPHYYRLLPLQNKKHFYGATMTILLFDL